MPPMVIAQHPLKPMAQLAMMATLTPTQTPAKMAHVRAPRRRWRASRATIAHPPTILALQLCARAALAV